MRFLFAAAAVMAAVWLVAPSPAMAQGRGRVDEVQVPAPSLVGNLVGTAEVQEVSVYLPPGYARGARRYPVVYLLHGIFDGRQVWTRGLRIAEMLDRMIAARDIPEVIVVMPEGLNRYGGGFYRNSPVTGNWADFISGDLSGYVDAHYRTLARPGGRAVIGWSMGGYGAIHLAMERPGLYAAAYAISPCCIAPSDDLAFGNDAWQRAYHFDDPSDIDAALHANDYYAVAVMGVMSAFATEVADSPFYVHFPLVFEEGQFVPEPGAYDRYLALFPLQRVGQSREALLQLRAFGIDYGINDQFPHIPASSREFSSRLSELRIPHRLDVYEGDHRNHVPERLENVVLPYVVNAMDRPE